MRSRIAFFSSRGRETDGNTMQHDEGGWLDWIRSKLILETPYDYASPISRTAGAPGRLDELVELQRRMNEDGLESIGTDSL